MTTTRLNPFLSWTGVVPAMLLSGLLAGCSGPPSAATPAAPSTVAAPPVQDGADAPTILMEKPDRQAVLATLKDAMTGSPDARGIDIRSFRFSGLTGPLEVLVQIERAMDPKGNNSAQTVSLITEGPPIPTGIVRMVLLPPAATGRESARVVLQVVPDGGGRVQALSRDVSPLWFGWRKRRLMPQAFLEPGKPLRLRGGKGLKLVSYGSEDLETHVRIFLDLRCRPAARPGG